MRTALSSPCPSAKAACVGTQTILSKAKLLIFPNPNSSRLWICKGVQTPQLWLWTFHLSWLTHIPSAGWKMNMRESAVSSLNALLGRKVKQGHAADEPRVGFLCWWTSVNFVWLVQFLLSPQQLNSAFSNSWTQKVRGNHINVADRFLIFQNLEHTLGCIVKA